MGWTDIYKDKTEQPRAIFATPIRGRLSEDLDEDDSSFLQITKDKTQPWKDEIFFASSTGPIAKSVIALINFGDERKKIFSNEQIQSFSFLSVDTTNIFKDAQ